MKLPAADGLKGYACTPANCGPACALAVVDELLRARTNLGGDELDALLDLRWLLHHRQDAETTLQLFCSLRRALEERHYLAFYRLRRWLENHITASIRIRRGEPERLVGLRMECYCLEAVRYRCLEAARHPGEPLLCPKVCFRFRADGGW